MEEDGSTDSSDNAARFALLLCGKSPVRLGSAVLRVRAWASHTHATSQ